MGEQPEGSEAELQSQDACPNGKKVFMITKFESLELRDIDFKLPKPSWEEPPTMELKPLPPHLKYVYLDGMNKLPVIISSALTSQ